MATIIEMPKLSDTMTEGTLVRWLKNPGDEIEVGMEIAEIETDDALNKNVTGRNHIFQDRRKEFYYEKDLKKMKIDDIRNIQNTFKISQQYKTKNEIINKIVETCSLFL